MEHRDLRRLGERRCRPYRLRGSLPAGGHGRSPGRAADPAGGVRAMTTIAIPELSLVVLVGVSGSGKSTFAAKHFRATEVLSSDAFRAMVADDANDQTVTREAFGALHAIAGTRLALGRLTVVDATNVQADARTSLVRLARDRHVLPI